MASVVEDIVLRQIYKMGLEIVCSRTEQINMATLRFLPNSNLSPQWIKYKLSFYADFQNDARAIKLLHTFVFHSTFVTIF